MGEAPPLLLSGARIKLLALIDVEKEGRRPGLLEFVAAALGGVDQVGEGRLVQQKLNPTLLLLHPLGIGGRELPSVEEAIDQRLDGLGAGLQRQKAPLPAVLKDRRPGVGRAGVGGPGLTLERGENAGLRQRGFAHPGIANEQRQPALRRERVERPDRFPRAAEVIIAVLLLHRFEAAIGRRVSPQLRRSRAAPARGLENSRAVLLGGRIGRDDPVQLAQERQTGRDLPFNQNDDEREGPPGLHPTAERLEIFGDLPIADAAFADEQNEGGRPSEFLGELIGPGPAGAHVRGREEDAQRRVLALDRALQSRRLLPIRAVVAEKPMWHAFAPSRPRA